MASINKIETYNLGELVLKLTSEGRRTYQIPEELNRVLAERGITNARGEPETISQPTVSRWLKEFRKDIGEQARANLIQKHTPNIPVVLNNTFEVHKSLMGIFRGKKKKIELGDQVSFIRPGLKERINAGIKAIYTADKYLKFIGLTEEQRIDEDTRDEIDPDEKEYLKKIAKKSALEIMREEQGDGHG